MSIYERVQPIGGQKGTRFNCTGGSDGKVLEKIGVWIGGWQIKAIRIWLTDDSPKTFGHPTGPYKEFSFEPGEYITRLSLWGNGAGTRTGWIHFETSKARSFDHGMNDWGKKQEYPIDVGSGICVGVMGASGADVDSMGFVFLKPISYAQLIDVSYPTLGLESAAIVPKILDQISDENHGNQPRNWNLTGTKEVSLSSSWSFSVGLEVYNEITVEASVPEIAKVSGKFGWKLSASATYQKTSSTKQALKWEESGTLQPGQSISLKALTKTGKIVVPYEGSMKVKLKSGEVFTYPIKGMYEGLSYTGVEISDT